MWNNIKISRYEENANKIRDKSGLVLSEYVWSLVLQYSVSRRYVYNNNLQLHCILENIFSALLKYLYNLKLVFLNCL